jgi:glutamate/tyrosine decarboxylase-like PLP-dependent enzyme
MGCTVVRAGVENAPLTGADVRKALAAVDPDDVVAVVATAGTTNTGLIDDLAGIDAVRGDTWLHVDAAYGGAAMLSERCRPAFAGIDRADSVTVDPHKWLFTPFDCAAVLYREPAAARAAHRQHADYLEPVNAGADNPADYGVHLSRRARGLPLWMSLLAHGTAGYRTAVERCLDLAAYAAAQVGERDTLEPAGGSGLSVVVFRRVGWSRTDYVSWSERARTSGIGLVTPTRVAGAPALRFCFVNPLTTEADVDLVLDSLARVA